MRLEEVFLIIAGGAILLTVAGWALKRLMLAVLPSWLVGPGGFLIDTRGRLGILQMDDHHHSLGPDAGRGSGTERGCAGGTFWSGGGTGGGSCGGGGD